MCSYIRMLICKLDEPFVMVSVVICAVSDGDDAASEPDIETF